MALFDPKTKTINSLQRSIDEKNLSVTRLYDEIGRLYYTQYKDDSVDVSRDINARCEAIGKFYSEIETDRLRILFEKGLKVCAKCKKENPLEHIYCSVCGTKFPDGSDTRVQAADAVFSVVDAAAAEPVPSDVAVDE